ncbi:hypothetical protein DIPPA_06123 [Diplonema papillatum]|nr:hypothetical protein DIPPA_06123 [Diplonema papillatum]
MPPARVALVLALAAAAAAEQFVVFNERELPAWPAGTAGADGFEVVEADRTLYRGAAQVTLAAGPGAVAFDTAQAASPAAIFSNASDDMCLFFDVRLTAAPSNTSAAWVVYLATEAAGDVTRLFGDVCDEPGEPVLDAWSHYTCNLTSFGSALGAITAVGIRYEAGTGAGAVYLLDNVEIGTRELVIFEDGAPADWPLYDCCGGGKTLAARDPAPGKAAEFSVGADTLLGFGGDGVSVDASRLLVRRGAIKFEVKVVTEPTDSSSSWNCKIESSGADAEGEVSSVSLERVPPVLGAWRDFTVSIAYLDKEGVNVSAINRLLIFPTWGKGAGAVYQVDNVRLLSLPPDVPMTAAPELGVLHTAFTYAPFGGRAGTQIMFDGSLTQHELTPGVTLVAKWDFGDGTESTVTSLGAQIPHTYREEGVYKVVLSVAVTAPQGFVLSESAANYVKIDADRTASAGIPDNRSGKRGVAFSFKSSADDLKALASGSTWWYNWGTEADGEVEELQGAYGAEYLPMAWDESFDDAKVIAYLERNPQVKYLLAFNEPNFKDQASMTPSESAREWPRLEVIAKRFNLQIVGVALNYCGNCVTENGTTYTNPFTYLDDFFAACPNCQVDALAVHAYMPNYAGVKSYVEQFYTKYNLPVWITEFCAWETTTTLEQQKTFLVQTTDYFEQAEHVARYAWFIGRSDGHPYNTLLNPDVYGAASELGSIYVNLPIHGNSSVHTLPKKLQAEDYAEVSKAVVQLTKDAEGLLEMNAEAEGVLDYNVKSANVTYNVTIRYSSETNTQLQLKLNGTLNTEVILPATGASTSASVETTMHVESGNHKLNVWLSAPATVNWLHFVDPSAPTLPPTVPPTTTAPSNPHAPLSPDEAESPDGTGPEANGTGVEPMETPAAIHAAVDSELDSGVAATVIGVGFALAAIVGIVVAYYVCKKKRRDAEKPSFNDFVNAHETAELQSTMMLSHNDIDSMMLTK